MSGKTACITGHRKLSRQTLDVLRPELKRVLKETVEGGVTTFKMQLVGSADYLAAELIAEMKHHNPEIKLHIYLAYENLRESPRNKTEFNRIIQQCDNVVVTADEFFPNAFLFCIRKMMQNADELIAIYDGREKGITVFTMRYAAILGIPTRAIACVSAPQAG